MITEASPKRLVVTLQIADLRALLSFLDRSADLRCEDEETVARILRLQNRLEAAIILEETY